MVKEKNKQPAFIPGLDLAEGFFKDAVYPILESHQPKLKYSAALIGFGSEVLGFDTEMSMDHHWGPRVMLFLEPKDFNEKKQDISNVFSYVTKYLYLSYVTKIIRKNGC